jgi:hypothetical protein
MDSSDGSSQGSASDIADILQQEPMYYVLSQFLETPKNKNIACILEELVQEVRQLRITMAAAVAANAPASNLPQK